MPPKTPLTVSPVASSADHRAFWTLPYAIYRDVAHWPAPLRRDERNRWDVRRNPTLATRRVWRFVARRGREVCGRIAAVLDPGFAARWAPRGGLFGFFETFADAEVSTALLEAAESVLQAEGGVEHVFGPVNLSFHDEMGLLIDGFDLPPPMLSPFNPPYYPALLVAAGYRAAFDQHAYTWSSGGCSSALLERASRRAAAAGVRIRPLRPDRWEGELRLLQGLYNACFQEVWGFVPISWSDFRARAEAFRAFYRPELVLIAEQAHRQVGFILALPDLGPLLARIRGRMWPFGAAYLALGLRSLRRGRCMLLGVLPEFVGRGVAAALILELIASGNRAGIQEGELSLVHGGNTSVRRLIEASGGTPIRTYRVYHKALVSP